MASMGHYKFLLLAYGEIYGGLWGCSLGPMGCGETAVAAVWHLWGTVSSCCLLMGQSMGTYGAAVSDLWGTYGDTPLRSHTYGASMGTISSRLIEMRTYRNEDL